MPCIWGCPLIREHERRLHLPHSGGSLKVWKARVWPELTPQYAARIRVLIPDQQLLYFAFKDVHLKETTQRSLMCNGGASRAWRATSRPSNLERGLTFPTVTGTQLKQCAFLSETRPLIMRKS